MVQWLRMQVLGMEVPGSNSGKVLFLSTFLYTFLPHGDCSIRVSPSHDFTFVWFLFYNFIAVVLLLFKLSKGTATMKYKPIYIQVIPILSLPCSRDRSLIFFM